MTTSRSWSDHRVWRGSEMSDEDDDDTERQLRELEPTGAVVNHRIERAELIYNHAINTLWAGNGTASLAMLGAI